MGDRGARIQVDCRGLSCPEPVLRTKKALEEAAGGDLSILVDDVASRENVRRFAESRGAAVTAADFAGGGWELRIGGAEAAAPSEAPAAEAEAALGTAILIVSDQVGPEPELGKILMRSLLGTLGKASRLPAKLLFLNRGVHLTTEGSEVLDVLAELEAAGVEVLSCGTCLEFFGKREKLKAGRVSNMYDTVESLTGRFKVVTIG